MNQFKAGDKVYVKKVGKWAVVLSIAGIFKGITKYDIKDEEGYSGWVVEKDLEKFIEPKFKVGDKVLLFPIIDDVNDPQKGFGEIVKTALNKKLGRYIYVVFATDDGYPVLQREGEVVLAPKKKKDCVGGVCEGSVEMTLAQVCKKLGKNIKIVK